MSELLPRILVTREDPGPLAEALARAGGEPIVLPLLRTRWLEWDIPGALDDYEWVGFTSVRALEAVARAAERHKWGWPPAAHAAAVGGRTADELRAQGWRPECVAPEGTAASLVAALAARGVIGARILFPCSAIAETTFPDGMRAAGARVDVVPVYTTEAAWEGAPEQLPLLGRDLRQALADAGCVATCASPSAARALHDLALAAGAIEALRRTPVVVLGPTTAEAVEALGLHAIEAGGRTLACLARKAIEVARSR